MKTIYECSQSRGMKWLTVAGLLIIVSAIVYEVWCLIQGMALWIGITVIVILLATLIAVFLCYPQYIITDDAGIGIHTAFRTRTIPYSNIRAIVRLDEDFMKWNNTVRVFGIGGMMGNIGFFRSKKIGNYQAYVTDKSKAFLIIRHDGQPIAISVSEPDEFLPYYLKGGNE